MATFSVKLVDHVGGNTEHLRGHIGDHIRSLFDEVFAGTSDSATVAWGTASATDALVLHFVEDVDSSYVSEKMPGKAHRPDGGGFTRSVGSVTGSEFYHHPVMDGERSRLSPVGYAKLAFHEAMHNKTGMSNDALHGEKGGGGLASSPPHLPLSGVNKTLMQAAMARKNDQLQ